MGSVYSVDAGHNSLLHILVRAGALRRASDIVLLGVLLLLCVIENVVHERRQVREARHLNVEINPGNEVHQ